MNFPNSIGGDKGCIEEIKMSNLTKSILHAVFAGAMFMSMLFFVALDNYAHASIYWGLFVVNAIICYINAQDVKKEIQVKK